MNASLSESLTHILTLSFQEILGQELPPLNSNEAATGLSSADLSATQTLDMMTVGGFLETRFGERGALGVASKAGEAGFRWFLRIMGDDCGLNSNDYRLKNASFRYWFGLQKLAEFFSRHSRWQINAINNPKQWTWQVIEENSAPELNHYWLQFFAGLLREYLIWGSGGRFFVMEADFNTSGTARVLQIEINKVPLGN